MFGLDARIALGVFGLLSLITGYLAFGRIQTAKDTKLLHEIQSIEQALKGYQADMGTFYLFTLNKNDNEDGLKDLEALWDKDRVLSGFQKHWNGPYLHMTTRKHREFGSFSLLYAQGDRKNLCTTDSDCYIWLALTDVPDSMWREMNRMIDEAQGKQPERGAAAVSEGRLQADEQSDVRTLFYRTIARPQ